MAQKGPNSRGLSSGEQLAGEAIHIIGPSLKAGGLSGLSGLLIGSFVGIARSRHPVAFALAASIQGFTVGTTFWATRATTLRSWGEKGKKELPPKDRILASGIGGCVGGSIGALFTRHKGYIPVAVVFGLLGAGGQKIYNLVDARRTEDLETANVQKKSWLDSKWSPVSVLTDEEYENMLQEKLLRVNAEIALVDESIEALRDQRKEVNDASTPPEQVAENRT